MCNRAEKLGLGDFHVLVIQEVVYNSLSPPYRELFTEIELEDIRQVQKDFQMMFDQEAKYIYFHVLE